MILGRRILGLITARGGSKGVQRKNVLSICEKPLIVWSIDAAKGSKYLDRLVVSTDDVEIAEVARGAGAEVPFMRPARLATDEASSVDVAVHALTMLSGYDALVLLQPTSPLRTSEDIDACIDLWATSAAPSCVSVCVAEQHPSLMYRIAAGSTLQPILGSPTMAGRRQDLSTIYVLNGAVYVVDASRLIDSRTFIFSDSVGYPMPVERSIDIDSELDIKLMRALTEQPR